VATVEKAETDEAILACRAVMAELRPRVAGGDFLKAVRALEADGLRLACVRDGGRVVAVAGYRISTNLFCGRHLYVDDLVTAESERSRGHGKALLAWLRQVAVENDCDVLHLDSGVQRKRAHQFYLREGLELSSYHFCERLKPRE
jgi:GNAT superfamily N-acetyltransferase